VLLCWEGEVPILSFGTKFQVRLMLSFSFFSAAWGMSYGVKMLVVLWCGGSSCFGWWEDSSSHQKCSGFAVFDTVKERLASPTCGGAGGHTDSGRTFPWCVEVLRRYVDVLLVCAGRCDGKHSGLDFKPTCDLCAEVVYLHGRS
jgi:hypothetical protein